MNNIKQLRKEKGLSVTALAALLHVSQSNLTKIENGQVELKPELATQIANVLQVSQAALTQVGKTTDGSVFLPLINPEFLNLPPLTHLPIPQVFCRNVSSNTALYAMEDDTMLPKIAEGAVVLIDKEICVFSQNGIYLLQIDGKMYLRRLQETLDKKVNIIADNQSYLPEQVEISNINIIGKARCCISAFEL